MNPFYFNPFFINYILFLNLCNANYFMYYIVQLNTHHLAFVPFNFNISFPLVCLYENHICSTISMCDLLSLTISYSSIHFVVELLLSGPMCYMLIFQNLHTLDEYAFCSFTFGSIFQILNYNFNAKRRYLQIIKQDMKLCKIKIF